VALGALYLRGLPGPLDVRRACWGGVDAAVRAAGPGLGSLAGVLREVGFTAEAWVLDAPGVLARAEDEVGARRVLTACSGSYPRRWLDVLGHTAPPAVWVRGSVPCIPFVAVVGSRAVPAAARRFARQVAEASVASGYAVVSGGAAGCDRAAAGGAGGALLEIVPCGLAHRRAGTGGEVSVCAPYEPFSSATAMERNGLVYAASDLAVVVHARFKKGGTWHGAVDALRRRLAPLAVRWVKHDSAARALVALGASPMQTPSNLLQILASNPREGGLFRADGTLQDRESHCQDPSGARRGDR